VNCGEPLKISLVKGIVFEIGTAVIATHHKASVARDVE
jgi:hypothetical protein